MWAQYYCAPRWRWCAFAYATVIGSLWIANSLLSLALNDWTRDFFDELQRALDKSDTRSTARGKAAFEHLMWRWLVLSAPFVLLMPLVNYLTRRWSFQWRQALTEDYLYRWLVVAKGSVEVEGASQRMQEDTHRFARLIDSLGQGFLSAVLQLISFSPLLWVLSSGLPGLPDGALVYLSACGNLVGVGVSFIVGYYLVSLEYNNQAVEASFRKELVYAEDGAAGHGGLSRAGQIFLRVRDNYLALYRHLGFFEMWIHFFDRAMSVLPLVLLAPLLYSGDLSLGAYMQAISAFEKVQSSLSILMHRWIDVNELRAVERRLREFERLLPPASPEEVAATHDHESSALARGGAASYGTAEPGISTSKATLG